MQGASITCNSVVLALIAVCAIALITGTYQLTRDDVARQERLAQEKTLAEIVPGIRHDNMLLDDTIAVGPQDAGLGLREEKRIHVAREGSKAVAVIIPAVAPDGYAGDIDLIVGVNRDGTVAGVRVLGHRETPGLGDKVDIEKSQWVLGFNGRSLRDPALEGWGVRKDEGAFDQFTGATITPRAVVAATRRALQFAEANRERLFGDRDPNAAGDK